MPVQTPQDPPGTSSITAECTSQPPVRNPKKRAGTEMGDEARDAKKVKVEATTTENAKDKDKKKKKKKKKTRRTSVVLQIAQTSVQREPVKARSSTMPPALPSPSKRATSEPKHSQMKVDSEGEQVSSSSDKGKGRAHLPRHAQRASATLVPPQQPVASGSGPSSLTTDQASEIAALKAQLASQRSLLERHQHHFAQHQQSLTCQICLDLMHKPYALAPCGHMTCYGCLVRWFTAPTNTEAGQPVVEEAEGDGIDSILNSAAATTGTFLRRRKNCPVCRASVTDRPIEMWGIKGMVASLVKSGLAELPLPAPANVDVPANTDPWRNIFRQAGASNYRHPFEMAMHGYFMPPAPPPPPAGEENREAMGWYDGEDGGIYRCIDCYHEIFYGQCSRCRRPYPGHGGGDDDDDDFDDDDDDPGLPENFRRYMRGLIGEEDDLDDDESIDEEGIRQNRLFWEHQMDGEELDDEEDEDEHVYGGPFDPAEFGSDGEDDDDEDIPPRLFGDRRPQHHHQLAQMLFGHAGPTPRRAAQTDQVVEEEEEEEDSDYEGSFINDGPDSAAGDTELDDDDNALDHQVPNPSRERRHRRVELSSDVEEPRLLARRLGRASRQAPSESDDDDEVEVVSGPAPIPRHQQRSRVLSSDEGSGYESPPRRLRRNVTVTSVLDSESEEEDALQQGDDYLYGGEVDSDDETGSLSSRGQYTYPLSDGDADLHHYGENEDDDDDDDGW